MGGIWAMWINPGLRFVRSARETFTLGYVEYRRWRKNTKASRDSSLDNVPVGVPFKPQDTHGILVGLSRTQDINGETLKEDHEATVWLRWITADRQVGTGIRIDAN